MAAIRRRAFRDWRNRFNAKAKFIWFKPTMYNGVMCQPGDPVDSSSMGKIKLQRFWQSGVIDLAPGQVQHKKSTAAMIAETEAARAKVALAAAADAGSADESSEVDSGGGGDQ